MIKFFLYLKSNGSIILPLSEKPLNEFLEEDRIVTSTGVVMSGIKWDNVEYFNNEDGYDVVLPEDCFYSNIDKNIKNELAVVLLENMVDQRLKEGILSPFGFFSRFTFDERKDILKIGKKDDIITVFLKGLDLAKDISLNDPATIGGLDYMISIGLLDPSRKAEILS